MENHHKQPVKTGSTGGGKGLAPNVIPEGMPNFRLDAGR
jgi:hypothetical protein